MFWLVGCLNEREELILLTIHGPKSTLLMSYFRFLADLIIEKLIRRIIVMITSLENLKGF